MNIGELTERVQFIQAGTLTQARNGDLEGEEGAVYSCWAKVWPMSGFKQLTAEQVNPGTNYEIVIRYPNSVAITEDMNILWRGKRLTQSRPPISEKSAWHKLLISAVGK